MVGFLNSHPDIFILYETGLFKPHVSRYGNALLKFAPEARRLFRTYDDIAEPYHDLNTLLAAKTGRAGYTHVGDKIISFDASLSQPRSAHKTIYMFRDVRTWLCKEQTVSYYRTDLDIVAPAIELLKYMIAARSYSGSLCIAMEDFIGSNDESIAKIETYLGVSFPKDVPWWETVGVYDQSDPKSSQNWASGHYSSKTKPSRLDTTVTLKKHPFWDAYLPMFDRYFADYGASDVSEPQRAEDIETLAKLLGHSPIPLSEVYENVDTRIYKSPEFRKKFSWRRAKYEIGRFIARRRTY